MASQRELVEQLFEAALSLAPMERDAFLQEKCGSNPELKRIVQDLLTEHARAGSFLQHPPLDFLEKANTVSIADTATTIDGNGAPLFPTAGGRLNPGQTLIDRFVIVRFIAKGGMGAVYEAEDRFLQGVHVALKTILRDIADDPASQKRFEREVLLAREVTHANLCPIYDIFRCEEQGSHFLFLTMKLLPGENLAQRLHTATPIPTGEGVTILKQLAAGLDAIHTAGIIHRDIKPNNIMLDGSGPDLRLWITDFGLARAHEAENTVPGKEVIAGTPGYMAPELMSGQPPSQATDLFAFGVVMHQVFTGQKPIVKAGDSAMITSPRLSASGYPSPFVQLVKGCLDLDPNRRCQSFEQALVTLQLKRRTRKLWTRRQFAGTAAAAVCALAGGAWLEREAIYDYLHPLPGKRFVALLNWPKTSDRQVAPMLTGALSAIKSELARMEAFTRNLLVISPEDAHQDASAATQLREVCDPLGANLVLAASGLQGSKHFQLFLRLLDPSSDQPLREKELTCGLAEITSLPGKAVQAVASLLDLSRYLRGNPRMEPETRSIASFTAFQTAESLMKQPDDTGLDAAIDKYKEAVQLDPHYAVAHARLAQAFVRLYTLRHDSAALDHARGNCQVALTLAPRLVDSHHALALVLLQTGNAQGALDEFAKALALDPSNPYTLIRQARIYTRLNRWADAERTFQEVLKKRPNFWCAYSELGLVLHSEGKVQASINAYRAASVAAPRSSSALSTLGAEYLLVGEFAEATECFRRSMVLDPDSDQAAVNTSLGLRCQGKYEEALLFALKAVELNPATDINWLELADCYSQLSGRQREAKGAYLRAAEEAERHLLTDPADGPSWLLLALYKIKSGNPQNAPSFIKKAESLGANDTDSQLYKVRILELLGKREDALATLADCFRKGATTFEMAPFPDMRSLRKDPRYWAIVQSKSARTETTPLPEVEDF
jgi:eukaryotic-like serine/threonine-protein kinase